MSSNATYFLGKTLGEDFLESLNKSDLWKPGTKSVNDIEDMRIGLKIVPRAIMALLVRELSPLGLGENKRIRLQVGIRYPDAHLNVTKHERDQYSGDIDQAGKKLTEFKFRSLPGIGLVIMSTFELYDTEELKEDSNVDEEANHKIQRIIDERLALHDLVGKVVDKKIMEKEAIHALVLAKLTEALKTIDNHKKQITEIAKISESSAPQSDPYFRGMTNGIKVTEAVVTGKEPKFVEAPKKKGSPVKEFLEKRQSKKEFSIQMAKSEKVNCPDCGKNIFDGAAFSGCICLGDDMERKVFIKKSEDGIKVRFSKNFDPENIEMILEMLRKKRG